MQRPPFGSPRREQKREEPRTGAESSAVPTEEELESFSTKVRSNYNRRKKRDSGDDGQMRKLHRLSGKTIAERVAAGQPVSEGGFEPPRPAKDTRPST